MSRDWNRRRVLDAFGRWQRQEPDLAARLDAGAQAYVDYHAVRYARLLEAVETLARRAEPGRRFHVLDVGPNVQTALLRTARPEAVVDTLGFAHPAVPPRPEPAPGGEEHSRSPQAPRPAELHIEFDLNLAPDRGRWPALERRYDVILMAEVVEHLHVPPSAVLAFLGEQLRRPGFVVLQTPNAAALHKRLTLLVGRNPIEAPRTCQENPGHLHEYTLRELRQQVVAGGLSIDWLRSENYFGSGGAAGLYRATGRLLPATWRHGVTVCARA